MENSGADLYTLFKEKAEAVSTRVIRVEDCFGASRALAEIIEAEKTGKIVADSSEMVTRCVNLLKRDAGLFFNELRIQSEDADMGISEMYACVAETGSIAGDCTSMGSRLVSTLPPVHVALIPSANIAATPGEVIRKFYGKGFPAVLTFITGPSRTADIERVLTIGVHGPEKLYVILVDDTGGGSCG